MAIESTFDKGKQGWTIQGDANAFRHSNDGDPGGCLHWNDAATGEDCYYQASSAYEGDKHSFYGGTLSYDIRDTGNTYSGVPDVEIIGANGTTLVATVGQAGTDWTHLSISIVAGADWHVGSLDGAVATKADFKGVLADVSQMLIRAEYIDGPEKGDLDNVVLAKAISPRDVGFEHVAHIDAHPAFLSLHGLEHLAIV